MPSGYHFRLRRKVTLVVLAVVCTVVGIIHRSPSGDFIAGTAFGVLAMLLVLHVASRRPALSGGILGWLGGMVAAATGTGSEGVSSWSGFIGGVIAILASVIIERDVPVPGGLDATQ